MLASTAAFPNPLSKSEASISQAEIDIDEIIPPINSTEHALLPRGLSELFCLDSNYGKWAADGRYAIHEVGKKGNLNGKNIYEVAGKFCHEINGHKFSRSGREYLAKSYWFKSSSKTFPFPFVPVQIQLMNMLRTPGTVSGKSCADIMAKIISTCTRPGKPSRFNHFRGAQVQDERGWSYSIGCVTDDCSAF
ncbi:hypothetical protein ACJ72_07512 [Emergomyces africanus]|uniref:Uncharacterized protein n=1 Tax=Emergomyces africanus TaxID=1955775 RepID=A0A1B7NMZ2_9EURO|nr:hypothetical protein ACJ72_07512 [Emergomyces africanus]